MCIYICIEFAYWGQSRERKKEDEVLDFRDLRIFILFEI